MDSAPGGVAKPRDFTVLYEFIVPNSNRGDLLRPDQKIYRLVFLLIVLIDNRNFKKAVFDSESKNKLSIQGMRETEGRFVGLSVAIGSARISMRVGSTCGFSAMRNETA